MNDKIFKECYAKLQEQEIEKSRKRLPTHGDEWHEEKCALERAYADWLEEQGRLEEAWKQRRNAGDVDLEYILVHKPTGKVLKNYGMLPGNLTREIRGGRAWSRMCYKEGHGVVSAGTAFVGLTAQPYEGVVGTDQHGRRGHVPLEELELRLRVVRRETVMSFPGRAEALIKKGSKKT